MKIVYHPDHTRHDPGVLTRPEQAFNEVARRGVLIYEAIQAAGFGSMAAADDFGLAAIASVHTPALLEFLQHAYQRHGLETGRLQAVRPDTFAPHHRSERMPQYVAGQMGRFCFDTFAPILEQTWSAAYWSAQVTLTAATGVNDGERLAYALCRPPGHHAAAGIFGGYCYLNNTAIAAAWLADQGRRVAIVDVDYHHGNGTQAIFYDRADVLFCSLHGDPIGEYPYYWGYADERGLGAGEGTNFNYPLPFGTAEAAYLSALDDALERVRRFSPDILLISLGVDTCLGDPEGLPNRGFRLQTDSFARCGERFAAFDLPTCVIQEGGYLLESLGANVVAFLGGLLD